MAGSADIVCQSAGRLSILKVAIGLPDMRSKPGPPMLLANMRQNGVRAVTATCANCGRSADVNVDLLPETLTVPETGKRLRCSNCGGKTISTRPAWHTGSQRHGVPYHQRERPPMS